MNLLSVSSMRATLPFQKNHLWLKNGSSDQKSLCQNVNLRLCCFSPTSTRKITNQHVQDEHCPNTDIKCLLSKRTKNLVLGTQTSLREKQTAVTPQLVECVFYQCHGAKETHIGIFDKASLVTSQSLLIRQGLQTSIEPTTRWLWCPVTARSGCCSFPFPFTIKVWYNAASAYEELEI